jgi:hypothetical protein
MVVVVRCCLQERWMSAPRSTMLLVLVLLLNICGRNGCMPFGGGLWFGLDGGQTGC